MEYNGKNITLEDGKTVKDLYTPDAVYLIDWFESEFVGIGFNGPILLPISNYPNFDSWLSCAFKFLYSLLIEEANTHK